MGIRIEDNFEDVLMKAATALASASMSLRACSCVGRCCGIFVGG